ncbi:TetR family transcriptional regulator [Streptomyces olivaceoviridis]|uniref:TetR/AcrR family transcriptional regulator n=1 Tax=Streptomyces olivaceoviridis TaxID=1921 RepID=UPI00167B1EB8|nr:TetR family transcriptional regulator [Streptomyces olivaceoviridis]GGY64944.1 TetR family transcriptional regulator [Streptomyces olivaceoviridis]
MPDTTQKDGTSEAAQRDGTSEARTSKAGTPEARASKAGAPEKEQAPRRRQARGERRVTQLLEAAAQVFCTTGYTAASTNAIARAAGVSPGTLYQFFPNKEAIAIELGDRLMHEMREAYGEALAPVDPATPLEEAIGSAVDRFMAFNTDHPAFFALMHGPDVPGRMAEAHDQLHTTVIGRIEALLGSLVPGADPADVTRTARVCLGIYKAGLELVLAHQGAERAAYIRETKDVLIRYLEPLVGDRLGRT